MGAALGDGAAGLALIGLLMALFLGVYLLFRAGGSRAPNTASGEIAQRQQAVIVDGTLVAAGADDEQAAAEQAAAEQAAAQPAGPPEPKLDFARDVVGFFRAHCYDCHTGEAPEAGMVLDRYKDEAAVTGNRQAFAKILKMLRGGLMPPLEADQPPKDKLDQIVAWLDWKLNFVDCRLARDPGRVTIRRLNRIEYRHTVRDLLGVDFEGAKDFPADDVGYGFDNIGDVLSLPPILMEKYLDAAEAIVGKAIADPNAKPAPTRYAVTQTQGGSEPFFEMRALNAKGEVWVEHNFPAAGEYLLRANLAGNQVGDEPPKAEFRLDGKKFGLSEVKNSRREPRVFEHKVQAAAGKRRFAVAFINEFTDPKATDRRRRDRGLRVGFLEVAGPAGAKAVLPESHTRLITATPGTGRTWDAAAKEVLTRFVRRAYRRPPTPSEIDRLVALTQVGKKHGERFEQSIGLAVRAVLVSPHFLYRIELDPESSHHAPRDGRHAERDAYAVRTLNEHELATRLSYFLWSSMPDNELLAQADAGTLRRNLDAQVRRMLGDPKSAALVENFVGQWLQLRNLDTISPDPKRFPVWSVRLRDDMRRETELFFAGIVREDRSIFELIDADYTYLNERLARHYGIEGVQGDEFRRVSLTDRRRGGVLTQASVLTVTSSPTRTSPVKRGKWILEQILATEPPPPPANVEQLDEGKELTGSLRQRFEQHRSKPMCAICHNQMDPLGFGFENYNAIGQWREKDGSFAVDSSGELPDGRKFAGPVELKKILLADDAKFRRCLTEKVLTYALGRGLEYYDRCAVDDISKELQAGGDRFQRLVLAVVASEPFQKRRGATARRP